MDRTAIAAIIIGFGATVAAMVMPQKFPQAPKWAVDLSWWGGLFLIVAGAVVLLTEFTFADLGAAAHEWSGWIWRHLIWLLGLTAFWVVSAFVAGIAVHRWHTTLWKALPRLRKAGPQVPKWFTPLEAVERFVQAEMVAADRAAQERVKQLHEAVQLEETPELRERLSEAEYVAARRRTDLIDTLRIMLKMGLLVGKGRKLVVKRRELVFEKEETVIPMIFWSLHITKTDVLNLDLQKAIGELGQYNDVLIGKDENWKGPPRESSAEISSTPPPPLKFQSRKAEENERPRCRR